MSAELFGELSSHLALFACGALGYGLTKWASRRFGRPRLPPKKVLELDDEVEEAEEKQEKVQAESAAAPAPAAPRARRRAARPGKAAPAATPSQRARAMAAAASSDCSADSAEEQAAASEAPCPREAAEEAAEAAPQEKEGTPEEAQEDGAAVAETQGQGEEEAPQAAAAEAIAEEEQEAPEFPQEALDASPPSARDRLARLLAKKAARKQRKVREQRQLAQQLVDACTPPDHEAAVVEEGAMAAETAAEGEPAEPIGGESDEAASPEPETAGHTEETADECGGAQEEREMTRDELIACAEFPAGSDRGDEACPGADADDDHNDIHESCPRPHYVDPTWLLECLRAAPAVIPPSSEHPSAVAGHGSEAPEGAVGGTQRYTPILSADGQQLYTDGHNVYMMMACPDAALVATEGAPGPVLLPVTSPSDPLHKVAMNLGVIGDAGPCDADAGAVNPALPSLLVASPWAGPLEVAAPDPDTDIFGPYDSHEPAWLHRRTEFAPSWREWREEPEPTDDEDELWDICWEFIG